MQYNYKEEGLEIKLNWKERLSLFFRGYIKMNIYQSYEHSSSLVKLGSEGIMKYGDSTKHGNLK